MINAQVTMITAVSQCAKIIVDTIYADPMAMKRCKATANGVRTAHNSTGLAGWVVGTIGDMAPKKFDDWLGTSGRTRHHSEVNGVQP